jgi:hypothetical protein
MKSSIDDERNTRDRCVLSGDSGYQFHRSVSTLNQGKPSAFFINASRYTKKASTALEIA